jgi:hypothetical protein
MSNKEVLSKLLKIAENQQKVLVKLAQAVDPVDAETALNQFIKFQLTSWGMANEVAASVRHTAERVSGSKHFDVQLDLTLPAPKNPEEEKANQAKKAKVEDPQKGLAAFLSKAFTSAAATGPLAGYTATFNVTTK